MENIGQENHNIGETLETSDNNTMLPIIIEKEKSHTRNVKLHLLHRLKRYVKDVKY